MTVVTKQPPRNKVVHLFEPGKRFGRWTTLSETESIHRKWKCRCDCGVIKDVSVASLVCKNVSKSSRSCGCFRLDIIRHPPGESAAKGVFASLKAGANRRGLSVEISYDKYRELTAKNCTYCGAKPSNVSAPKKSFGSFTYNGIDRSDSKLGYIEGNCVPCCFACNVKKNTLSVEWFMNLKHKKRSEAELASFLISRLINDGWEVFQEVPMGNISADIVVKKEEIVGVVECKKSINFHLIQQAIRWRQYANFVWVAVPFFQKENSIRRKICENFGLGVFEIKRSGEVKQSIDPFFLRRVDPNLRNCLREEMKTGKYGIAGTNTGNRFTPFKETTEALCSIVRDKPGITLKLAIEAIKRHHYASNAAARVNLRKYIENGVIKGVRHETVGKKFLLYPTVLQ